MDMTESKYTKSELMLKKKEELAEICLTLQATQEAYKQNAESAYEQKQAQELSIREFISTTDADMGEIVTATTNFVNQIKRITKG